MKKILLAGLLIIIYQTIFVLFRTDNYFPSIFQIIQTFIRDLSGPQIYIDVLASLQRVIIGFLIAGILGVSWGLILGQDSRLKGLIVYIELLRPIPPIAWIPIAIIIFGLGNTSAYFIVFLGAFFPIFTNTYFGAASMPIIHKNIALSFEISKTKYFTKILLLYSLPYIFTGLKIGIGMAWMSVIAAELMGSQSGLGYFIELNRLLLQTDNIIIGMIIIGIIGYLLQKIIEFMERKFVTWK